jgi:hypothetical protein
VIGALSALLVVFATMHTDALGSAIGDNWNRIVRYPILADDPLVIMSCNQQETTNSLFKYVDPDLNEGNASTTIVKKGW